MSGRCPGASCTNRTRDCALGHIADLALPLHNQSEIVETNVGVGHRTRRATQPREPPLGEIAVDEYTTRRARGRGPNFGRGS